MTTNGVEGGIKCGGGEHDDRLCTRVGPGKTFPGLTAAEECENFHVTLPEFSIFVEAHRNGLEMQGRTPVEACNGIGQSFPVSDFRVHYCKVVWEHFLILWR